MSVFVLGSDNRPVMPCTEKRARLLLNRGRACVVRMYPFTIKMKDRFVDDCELQIIEVKIDPGSKFTGICVSRTVDKVVNVLNLIELEHRGSSISTNLTSRAAMRKARRARNTRYRQARYLNRTKPKGWLAPSLRHRLETTMSWISRLCRWAPVACLAVERVKFDMQKMRDPEISGVEYQQGTLFQYEVTEYLLEKWGRKCMYCGATGVSLEKEHLTPRSRGGTNAVSNLGLACRPCNQKKGSKPLSVFLAHKPALLKIILAQTKKPLRDAAAVNATRNALFKLLLDTGLPVAIGTGAQTKYNRCKLGIPKTHGLDAACVGDITAVNNWSIPHLAIKCCGRGRYARTILDKYGFPRLYLSPNKKAFGFQTGDIVKAQVKVDKGLDIAYSRVAIRQRGCFAITYKGELKSVNHKNCKVVQKADGYSYRLDLYSYMKLPNGHIIANRQSIHEAKFRAKLTEIISSPLLPRGKGVRGYKAKMDHPAYRGL